MRIASTPEAEMQRAEAKLPSRPAQATVAARAHGPPTPTAAVPAHASPRRYPEVCCLSLPTSAPAGLPDVLAH